MITRHQFLTMLHDLLKPKVYLEIGVQFGLSLDLAVHSELAIGIDPNPLTQVKANQHVYQMTSDEYFVNGNITRPYQIDLAFIDGSHLFEDALRDYQNVSRLCGPKSVIVFDDVLPYSNDIAKRIMPPGGDWTGDVWKVIPILRGKLGLTGTKMMAVDTFPTGTFVVWNMPTDDRMLFDNLSPSWLETEAVPDYILNRTQAHQAQDVLDRIKEDLCA